MAKQNCWEIKRCGREPNGAKVADLGVCPAATHQKASGIHGGKNGGRVCWVLAGTLCGGTVQGCFASKLANCAACEFYRQVKKEEGQALISPTELLQLLK